eukprot:4822612-Heterocapsa_arctica.AAC.1
MADEKARAEQLERIRRKVVRDIEQGVPRPADWDPAVPWTTVFRELTTDVEYWNNQIRDPVTHWLLHGANGQAGTPEEELA